MKLFYRAFDNSVFNTEEECLEHEAKRLAYRVFDEDGDVTYDLEDAQLAYIYPGGADKLKEELRQADLPEAGIRAYASGWHFLHKYCDEWTPLPESLIKRLAQGTP